MALGTPTYMAPEQAAADPHVDHRADIYALGAMAYEMLCGRPRFSGSTQQVIAAHIAEQPQDLRTLRTSVPPALSAIVMRCLEKRAADRWQSADEVRTLLRTAATPADTSTTGRTPSTTAHPAPPSYHHVRRVLPVYGAVSLGVLAAVYALMIALGLPDWVMPAAGGLLVIGTPIIIATTRAERRRGTTGLRPSGSDPLPWLTWRKALGGGVLAFGGLAVTVGLYMSMRLFGIGPLGTLMATGLIEDQERLILADFTNRTSDSTLGRTATELLRMDLSQSPNLNLLPAPEVANVLRRMQRDPSVPLSPEVAREIAQREGIKAVMSGEILSIRDNVVVSVSLVEARTGQVLTAERVATSLESSRPSMTCRPRYASESANRFARFRQIHLWSA